MTTPIALTPQPQPTQCLVNLTQDQLAAFITLLASASPAVLTLPEGKAFTDITQFHILSNGNGGTLLVTLN